MDSRPDLSRYYRSVRPRKWQKTVIERHRYSRTLESNIRDWQRETNRNQSNCNTCLNRVIAGRFASKDSLSRHAQAIIC